MSHALDDAAVAALFGLTQERTEHIGLLYEGQNGLERTPTQTGGTRSSGGAFRIPPGSLRGIFHNHPPRELGRGARGGEDAERTSFSGDDTRQARELGVPSYISAGDRTFKYDPRTKSTEEVLAEFPMSEFRAHIMRTLLNREPDDPRGLER